MYARMHVRVNINMGHVITFEALCSLHTGASLPAEIRLLLLLLLRFKTLDVLSLSLQLRLKQLDSAAVAVAAD